MALAAKLLPRVVDNAPRRASGSEEEPSSPYGIRTRVLRLEKPLSLSYLDQRALLVFSVPHLDSAVKEEPQTGFEPAKYIRLKVGAPMPLAICGTILTAGERAAHPKARDLRPLPGFNVYLYGCQGSV